MKWLIVVLLMLTACTSVTPVEQGPPIEVYFCERDDCVSLLVNILKNADDVVCALYSVSLPEAKAALADIHWITDDNKGALMHNKFCVINNSIVWTGSWNPTRSTKANNVVIVHSAALAQNYLDEFAELPGGRKRVRYPRISYNNRTIENYFCPEDACKQHVMDTLAQSEQSITFMLASFTDEDVMRLLQQKQEQGLDIKGIIDKSQKKAVATVGSAAGSIHHKVFIIDEKIVVTGSYNPTRNGNERNDENILIIHDQQIASKFLEEYKLLTAT